MCTYILWKFTNTELFLRLVPWKIQWHHFSVNLLEAKTVLFRTLLTLKGSNPCGWGGDFAEVWRKGGGWRISREGESLFAATICTKVAIFSNLMVWTRIANDSPRFKHRLSHINLLTELTWMQNRGLTLSTYQASEHFQGH